MVSQRFSTRVWRALTCGTLLWLTTAVCIAQDGEAGDEAATDAAAAAATGAAAMPTATGSFTSRVNGFTIENQGPWMRGERIKGRLPSLWATYMHGIVDFFATIVPWQSQFLPQQKLADRFDPGSIVSGNPYRKSPLPSLKLEAGQQAVTGVPIIAGEDLDRLAGQKIRVFVWMRGEETGATGHLWSSAPRMDVLIVEAGGHSVVAHRGPMATRGTFPWHCYACDVVLPSSAIAVAEVGAVKLADDIERERGVYLRLSNPDSGTAWFSTLSWEAVDETSSYTLGERQDPVTGSLAPNARFDELPVHLCSRKVLHRGMLPAYEWAFLAGAKRGAVNVPDILSRQGFDAYLEDSALSDSHHFLNGLARLPEWYHAGVRFQTLPPAEGGWLDYVGTRMVALQDTDTGFWGTREHPVSMGLTAAVVERMFGAASIPRADREPVRQPWLSCGIEDVPKRDAIVMTVLSTQCPSDDVQAERGAWSTVAYHHAKPEELALDSSCSLAATADAVFLLRRCSPGLGEELRETADHAVRQAMRRVWATCVLPTGLWKQNSDDTRVTHGAFMGRLIDASPILEYRVNPELPAPAIADVPPVDKGRVEVSWKNPSDEVVSLRLYAAPKDVPANDLSDRHLVGIIQSSDGNARSLDPLVLLRLMRDSAKDVWGMTWFEGYGGYTEWKVSQLPDPLVVSLESEPVTVVLKEPEKMNLFVAHANWYGETSPPVQVTLTVPAAVDEGIFDEEDEAEEAEEGAAADDKTPVEEKKEGTAEDEAAPW